MKIKNTEVFGIQRKIVADMTSESWETIPHVAYVYEADVTEFWEEYRRLNQNRGGGRKITVNTLLLKIICEGLRAAPAMNAHIEFNRKFVRGKIHTMEQIDISMPMVLPNGEMMTINLRDFGAKNLDEMTEYLADVNTRLENTNLQEAMLSVSIDNTINGLKKGRIGQALTRVLGSKVGKNRVRSLTGKAKKEYRAIPETRRITKRDIEQGTVTISNIGSTYREQKGAMALLEIIPPQVCAFGVGAIQEKPGIVTKKSGKKEIAIRKILPICIAFDHRALDFAEIAPFMKRLDEIFENPAVIRQWAGQTALLFQKIPA